MILGNKVENMDDTKTATKKPVMCCLFGGKSTEYEVSLMSVCSVLNNIDRDHFDVVTLGVTKDGRWLYFDGDIEAIRGNTWFSDESHARPAMFSPDCGSKQLLIFEKNGAVTRLHIDVVFPVMHGANAEDGTMQGLLTICGIPFVGPHHCASAIGMDKAYSKLVLANFVIPQANYDVIFRTDSADTAIEKAEAVSGYPLFVKPANAGSSVGASKASDREALKKAIAEALIYDDKAIVEEYISGREVECAVLGNDSPIASTPGEIAPNSEFYDYETKYLADTAKDYIPARISDRSIAAVQSLAGNIFKILGCRGLSRVDFFVTGAGDTERVIFNEINTLPGFTNISMYPKLFVHDGISYSALIDKLAELAMETR